MCAKVFVIRVAGREGDKDLCVGSRLFAGEGFPVWRDLLVAEVWKETHIV